MKSKLLFSALAPMLAACLSLAASCQIQPERAPKVQTGPDYKYHAFVGWGYTSTNQVTLSRSGLQGISASVTRDFGSHFGIALDGGHYAWSVTSKNPGNPTVDLFLAGPEVRGDLYDKVSAFAHVLLGGAHTGGVAIQPGVSFAGGLGMGLDYNINQRFAIRLSGDDIASSFTIVPYQTGFSPHERWNARTNFGVVYHF